MGQPLYSAQLAPVAFDEENDRERGTVETTAAAEEAEDQRDDVGVEPTFEAPHSAIRGAETREGQHGYRRPHMSVRSSGEEGEEEEEEDREDASGPPCPWHTNDSSDDDGTVVDRELSEHDDEDELESCSDDGDVGYRGGRGAGRGGI
ncbi:hypothetical protein GYMLUDRAFT_247846 [Collybiopsis luxurians FD-317 M1]|uniref:Uncharacterized protein n=1 Tax=Collybiopsis luxurians FD-317 M1 TaxID=944289 RepID=A0A0D0AZY6_9AGAR|nr:hypothetical protein GYMLUDRAFT_247846 [Collybiopsis luxurians FD-317 M1]